MTFSLSSRRKWLPQPLRKLSQGKVEKSTTTTSVDRPLPLLKKTGSDKRFKLPTGDKSGRAVSEGEEEEEVELDDGETPTFLEQNGGEDGEDDFELPPPMKPITEPILVATGNGPPGSTIPDELPGKRVRLPFFTNFHQKSKLTPNFSTIQITRKRSNSKLHKFEDNLLIFIFFHYFLSSKFVGSLIEISQKSLHSWHSRIVEEAMNDCEKLTSIDFTAQLKSTVITDFAENLQTISNYFHIRISRSFSESFAKRISRKFALVLEMLNTRRSWPSWKAFFWTRAIAMRDAH